MRHGLNRGQGAALQTGIDFSLEKEADIIITFDADGQHQVTDIERLVEPIIKGEVDVVLGSRFISSPKSKVQSPKSTIPFLRVVVLKLAVFFDRFRTGLKITDTHNGLRAFSYKAAQKIKMTQDGMAHASEILERVASNNLRYKEIPVSIKYTDYSKKKGQSIFNSFKILADLILGKISK